MSIPIIFLHIFKAAGTYFAGRFHTYFKRGETSLWCSEVGSHPFNFIQGNHIPFGHQKKFIPLSYLITLIREPVERVISSYYFTKQKDTYGHSLHLLSQALPLEECFDDKKVSLTCPSALEYQRLFLCNHTTRMIANVKNTTGVDVNIPVTKDDLELAIKNLHKFSFVGQTQKASTYWPLLEKKLSLPGLGKHSNAETSFTPKHRPQLTSTIEAIKEANKFDLLLWEYIKENAEELENLPLQAI